MIPELTKIRTDLRNFEVLCEQVIEQAQLINSLFVALQQAYNILQSRYDDLNNKYNNLINDKSDTDNKKPQETIPEVQN